MKSELERELGEEELRRSLSQAREERSGLAARVARAELSAASVLDLAIVAIFKLGTTSSLKS